MDSIRKNSPLLDHFWKLFAVAAALLAVYTVWNFPHPRQEPLSGTVGVSFDQCSTNLGDAGVGKGSPVTAHLTGGATVAGTVESYDHGALVLRVGSELDVIPWRNVVKVRVHER